MTLPEQLMLLNLQRDELEGRLRALSEERFIKWAENTIKRWVDSGAQLALLVLHARGGLRRVNEEQKVTSALQQDVAELTELLATLETTR